MQAKAVRFLRDVVNDADRADQFEDMTPEEYARHKRIQIVNPARGRKGIAMARPTRDELEARIDELEEENQALSEKLDSISEIAAVSEDDEYEEEDDDDESGE
jgi:hypothetical protein